MNDISKKISVHLSSWDVMSNLIEAYSCKSVQIWKETVNLRESLSRVVLNKDWQLGMKGKLLNWYLMWCKYFLQKFTSLTSLLKG